MTTQPTHSERSSYEGTVVDRFLENPNEVAFADLFNAFRPQLIAFFWTRSRDLALAEDLAQDVMFTVYRKAAQIRDRALFRAWLFKIARNALCRHFGKRSQEVETVELTEATGRTAASTPRMEGMPAFEFLRWMAFLDTHEREVMTLRFVEQFEYHEIASAKAIPIGTVQWRVFNAKKKLAPHLTARPSITRKAA